MKGPYEMALNSESQLIWSYQKKKSVLESCPQHILQTGGSHKWEPLVSSFFLLMQRADLEAGTYGRDLREEKSSKAEREREMGGRNCYLGLCFGVLSMLKLG